MKTIGIAGGTGFVGSHLVDMLTGRGYKIVIFTRQTNRKNTQNITYSRWDARTGLIDNDVMSGLDGFVNLSGSGIADKKWTEQRKKEIVESRVDATNFLTAKLKAHARNCKTFISAAAIGFYGPDSEGKIPFTEDAAPRAGFLAETCRQWELAAEKAAGFARTVILRFGVVLGRESGAFPKFSAPLSYGIIPILGSGRQVMSWIEVSDLCRLITFALDNEQVSGIYNAVSPAPVTQQQLMRSIAAAKGGVKIPVRIPSFLLRTFLGEMSYELLKSCTASAKKILDTGFTFLHPEITDAIKTIHDGQ